MIGGTPISGNHHIPSLVGASTLNECEDCEDLTITWAWVLRKIPSYTVSPCIWSNNPQCQQPLSPAVSPGPPLASDEIWTFFLSLGNYSTRSSKKIKTKLTMIP